MKLNKGKTKNPWLGSTAPQPPVTPALVTKKYSKTIIVVCNTLSTIVRNLSVSFDLVLHIMQVLPLEFTLLHSSPYSFVHTIPPHLPLPILPPAPHHLLHPLSDILPHHR